MNRIFKEYLLGTGVELSVQGFYSATSLEQLFLVVTLASFGKLGRKTPVARQEERKRKNI